MTAWPELWKDGVGRGGMIGSGQKSHFLAGRKSYPMVSPEAGLMSLVCGCHSVLLPENVTWIKPRAGLPQASQ